MFIRKATKIKSQEKYEFMKQDFINQNYIPTQDINKNLKFIC
jgi:hypothetical protein